ncbi:hypothetical protein CCACVL1_29597 [Corchorus capsularis]|uniref:Uncharacterized protein n=1 Tax=Corchorus capsularis TaxID=210143 RepID=A0A1R3G124_COCAP|nr:hypothetical protein CCACVL1_29597 [Corchorus capsularis]
MAESKEISKKRKLPTIPTTHSSMGVFSHSKSRIHLLLSRSGQSPPDSGGRGNHQDPQSFSRKRKSSSAAGVSSVGNDLSSVPIKDLRSRRVFSPSSADGVIRNCLDSIKNMEKSEVARNCLSGSQEAMEDGEFRKLGMSNEDFVQSTPPDAEILGAKQVIGSKGSDFSDQFSEKRPSENLQKTDGCLEKGFPDKKNGINSSTRSVLRPCSRAKLFKTPGSFSYRRLLPYLMDMEKASPEMVPGKSDSGKPLNTVSVESLASRGSKSPSRQLFNAAIQKPELQVSSEDRNLNCSNRDSSPSKEDSNLNKEKLATISCDEMMTSGGEITKTSVESPSNAQNLEFSKSSDRCDYDEVQQNSNDDRKQSEIEGMPKADVCHAFDAQHLNSMNPALSEMGGNQKCSLQVRVDNGSEVLEQVGVSNGECMSMSPPDSDTSSKPDTEDSRGNKVDCVSQGMNNVIEKSTKETCHKNNCQNSDKSLGSSPKTKMVPDLRLHLKLSKIPGSFSYKRLLPYLTEITNDYSCASGNDESPKVEKSSEEKPFSPLSTSGKEVRMETSDAKSSPVEHDTGDDCTLPVAAATAARCSPNKKLARSPPKQVANSPMITNSQKERGSTVEHAALDKSQRVETSCQYVVDSPAMLSSSFINPGILPSEGTKLVSNHLPPETEEGCTKSTMKRANLEKQIEADSFVEASIPPGNPAASLKKGILKRNPRGCRGICTCLSCSSFRLHAERSFEFSRNQMQDAEEVALDLIKELSFLRNMLEKSASGATDQTSICINQVKEACKKAADAEELAKARLHEMNSDLKIHCIIPGPSVRFANYVEELVIPIADSSSKKVLK